VWWISFLDGSVFIVQASSLAHARMLAALHGVGRVGHFVEGHFIDDGRAAVIPQRFIGRSWSALLQALATFTIPPELLQTQKIE
jgi:hypothetical protein